MDAADVNSNFLYIGQGSILPKHASGSMSSADSTYDLGSSATTWNGLYCGDINNTTWTATGYNNWQFIADYDVTETGISQVTFSGLTDAYETFLILAYIVRSSTGSAQLFFRFNADAVAGNYGYQLLSGNDVVVSASRITNINTRFLIAETTSSKTIAFGKAIIKNKPGYERTYCTFAMNHNFTNTVGTIEYLQRIWNNTADTITSIVFYGGGWNWETGTHFEIWGM